eukprot:TRINITY_DN283_c0_g1_i2.p1 TRINITY_DN283_c0_g1~~TRINITY_DN283_c0_g1_i2.p1  ORF type:complete len:102 (+),score=9.05 TRINITY_DN283_c0_g1_i2:122-427(+)
MVSITMSISISMTITMSISMAISTIAVSSISRPLAIVSMVSITTISIADMSISMTIAIAWLSDSHTQKGKRNSNQKSHVVSCSFSTTLPMYSALIPLLTLR